MSTSQEGGPPPENSQAGPTPTLNTLLSKPLTGDNATQPQTPSQDGSQQNGTSQPPSGAPPANPQVANAQQQDWQQQQPRSPAQQQMGQGDHNSGPPSSGHPGFPPQGFQPHPQYMNRPGMPAGYPGYPHPSQAYQYAPQMVRPGGPPQQPGDFVRMPPGPNPLEWSAHQKKMMEQQGNPSTPASVPAPSPANSSVAEDCGTDEKSRMDSPGGWAAPHGQRTPVPQGMPPQMQPPAGMMMHPGMQQHHPGMMQQGMMPPAMMNRKETIVDKLVGPPTAANPPRVMPERRAFFERLVAYCEQQGEPIQMVPQVSKQNVDLHRLYIAVRNRGGFEQVTKEKAWKNICADANPDISESSAAGYQLRKHYQKHLLLLECMETGKSAEEAVAFADKLKRQRKKEPTAAQQAQQQQQQGGYPGGAHGQPAPGSFPPGHPDAAYYHQQQQQQQGMPFPGGYPPGGVPPGYPPGSFPQRIPPGVTPMRAPHPQPHMAPQPMQMGAEGGSESQGPPSHQTLQVPSQHSQPATPGSQAGPASVQPGTPQVAQNEATGSQAGSRAPSAGPQASAATPDSSSRMSAGADAAPVEQREGTGTPGQGQQQQPSTSMGPSVQSGQAPPPGQYYGQPAPMYPNGPPGRPGAPMGYPGGYGGPPGGYHPGVAPGSHYPPGPPQQHPASHPGHPQHQQYLQQQQMWHQQQQQQRGGYPPNGPPSAGAPQPQHMMGRGAPAPYGYPPQQRMAPPPPQVVANQQGAASPGGAGAHKMRYSGAPMAHSSQYTPQSRQPPQTMAPQSAAAYPQQQPTAHPTPSSHPSGSSSMATFSHHHTFPTGSVEASVISQKRRRKIMARDLMNATPRRLIMSLRSGLETEAVWAMNALNVLLYDDSNPHPTLGQMPGLLNVLIEHFWATLSILYPDTFPLSSPMRSASLADHSSSSDSSASLHSLSNGVSRQTVKHLVSTRGGAEKKNYTKLSRTGRKVHVKEVEMPEALKRKLMLEQGTSGTDERDASLDPSFVEEHLSKGLGGGLAERVAARLRAQWDAARAEPQPRFSLCKREETTDGEAAVVPNGLEAVKREIDGEEEEIPDILLHRRARNCELSEGLNEVELKWPKATALTDRDELLYRLAMRALSLSNILRGFSFLPGSEHLMSKHNGLLFVMGRFLTLLADEVPVVRSKTARVEVDAPVPDPEPYEVSRKKAVALLDSDDTTRLLLVETASQLRDDAFVMLCHMSASLDLLDCPGSLSFPIYDGLLHWAVSSVPEATDPIPPAAISPRNYCLEVLCKMSVLERNVDMLLSTGAWPRLEKFIHVLARLLSMSEETHNREFSIVILNAFCAASEAVCYVAANDTNAISNLIAFIESSDQNMHQVMQTHGMSALRDNPEMMGTSVGMLRRAAAMLRHLVNAPGAYKVYLKYQQRLLQFTMSQLMDSRVAGMIADTLYEIQRAVREADETGEREKKEEEDREGEEKKEDSILVKKDVDDASSVSNDGSLAENQAIVEHQETKKVNGGSRGMQKTAASVKRVGSREEQSPPSKRACVENGFGEKKNGKLEKANPLQLKESRTENGSMAVVA